MQFPWSQLLVFYRSQFCSGEVAQSFICVPSLGIPTPVHLESVSGAETRSCCNESISLNSLSILKGLVFLTNSKAKAGNV